MSTKTLRKRIAFVAVSAMGLGLLTSVGAHATATATQPSLTIAGASSGTLGLVTGAGGTAPGAQTATITANGAIALTVGTGAAAATGKITVSGGTIASSALATAPAADLKSISNVGLTNGVIVVKPDAGSSVIVVKTYGNTTDINNGDYYDKFTVTVVASATVGTFSATKSYAKLVGTATGSATSYVDQAGANYVANGGEGIIDWTVNDSNGNDMPTSSIITASATNGALVGFTSGSEIGSSVSKALSTSDGSIYVAQSVSYAPVSTVVTISIDGVVWTSKALTIVGDLATIKLSPYTVGQTSSTGAFVSGAFDAAGNRLAITPTSDGSRYNATLQSVSVAATTTTADTTTNTFSCTATAGTGSVSVYYTNAQLKKIVSNDLPVSCAGDPYTWSAALDKSSYAPGDVATLTITAKDSKGNLTNGTAVMGTTAHPLTIAGGQLTAVSTPTNGDTFTSAAGVKTYKFTVGTTEGSYNLVVDMPNWQGGTNSSSSAQTSQTVPFSVKSSTASVTNAEVLAAIVKLIASINQQIAALQKALTKKK